MRACGNPMEMQFHVRNFLLKLANKNMHYTYKVWKNLSKIPQPEKENNPKLYTVSLFLSEISRLFDLITPEKVVKMTVENRNFVI